MVAIRVAGPQDAEALLALQHRLDAQSPFMLLAPGEREQEPGPLRARLAAHGPAGGFDLVAADPAKPADPANPAKPAEPDDPGRAGPLAGWLSVEVLPYRRAGRTGYLVIGVDANAAGRGIGAALLAAAAAEATRRGLRRLELTVMTDNLRALALYLRAGFQVEGLRRRALDRDGTLIDEYYMGLLLQDLD